MRRDEAFLLDMIQHARFLLDLGSTTDIQSFFHNQQERLSAQKALEIIGEAARKVSKGFKTSHGEVPWQDWIELRHTFVHEYFRVDTAELWNAVCDIPPQVLECLEPLLGGLQNEEE